MSRVISRYLGPALLVSLIAAGAYVARVRADLTSAREDLSMAREAIAISEEALARAERIGAAQRAIQVVYARRVEAIMAERDACLDARLPAALLDN